MAHPQPGPARWLEALGEWLRDPEHARRLLVAALVLVATVLVFGVGFLIFASWAIWQTVRPMLGRGATPPYWIFLPLAVVLGALALLHRSLRRGARLHRHYRRRLQAAEAGGALERRMLALAYLRGAPGQPRDDAAARYHLLQAAERGDRPAMLELARLLQQGIGGPVDRVAAEAWGQRALATEDLDAQTPPVAGSP